MDSTNKSELTESITKRALSVLEQNTNNYLKNLNEEQTLAVKTTEGAVLVLAGAGTGKTRVLTTRIVYILQQRLCYPNQILAVTFTNKAAKEIKERIMHMLETDKALSWIGTFHFIAARILRTHADLVGLTSNFIIIDDNSAVGLIQSILKNAHLNSDKALAKKVLDLIDYWKREGRSEQSITEHESPIFNNGAEKKIYALYQQRLKILNACDFNDILLYPITILQNYPHILKTYQEKFRYILIDEYQDINTIQYLFIRLLAQKPQGKATNFFCVGDEDQTIYKWRGAHIERLLNFEKDFPDAKIIRLERNYRSTQHILGAASHLIAHNTKRYGKKLFAHFHDDQAPKVYVHAAYSDREEAGEIGREILKLKEQGHALNKIAILVRMSSQTRLFEDIFLQFGIHYRIFGGLRFFDRKEVRDALAYFNLVIEPNNDFAFERIINLPKRGIGLQTLNLLHKTAHSYNKSLYRVTSEMLGTDELKPKTRQSLRIFIENIRRWRDDLNKLAPAQLAEKILEESGYKTLYNPASMEDENRLKNLSELINSIKDFNSLQEFLEYIALRTELADEDNSQAVNIMSLHISKGLEFDTVFLPGWEEEIFPAKKSIEDKEEDSIEEERRLAYVGITRAKRILHIWFTRRRWKYNRVDYTTPSRFIDELPNDHIIVSSLDEGTSYYNKNTQHAFAEQYPTPGWQRARIEQQNKQKYKNSSSHNVEPMEYYEKKFLNSSQRHHSPLIQGEVLAKSVVKESSKFSINNRVFHIKFGNGNVVKIEGNKLHINFDKAGEKTVLDTYVKKLD